MSHVHHCATCGEPVICDGSRVGCVEDHDVHCIVEDDGPVVCRTCGENGEDCEDDEDDGHYE